VSRAYGMKKLKRPRFRLKARPLSFLV